MSSTENIVEKMIEQHRGLQADLNIVADEVKEADPSGEKIEGALEKFSFELKGHLSLENEVFYVELLKKMNSEGKDTTDTESFIAEMGKIGEQVMAFLNKYNKASVISDGIADFKDQFSAIVEALNMRIESEESGVYLYWK